MASTDVRSSSVPTLPGSTPELLPKHQVEPRPWAGGTFLSGEEDGEDRKDSRPQEGHGHQQIDRVPQVRQRYPHCEAHQGPRARGAGWSLYFLLGLRVLRKALAGVFPVSGRRDSVAPFL